MTGNIIDKFVMQIVPELDKKDTKKLSKSIEKTVEKSTEKGIANATASGMKTGAKKGGGFLKKALMGAGAMIGGVPGLVGAFVVTKAVEAAKQALDAVVAQANQAMEDVHRTIDVADKLKTTADQTGMNLENFLKIQKTMEFNDVDLETSSQAMIEFSKRLGEFRATGAHSEIFGRLNIKPTDSDAEIFLKAISATQKASGSEKQMLADQFFGGIGNEKMGEFLSGDLAEQQKAIKDIDFEKLGDQVEKGSDEQSKITKALAESSTKKLLEEDLDSDAIVGRIGAETDREIARTQTNYEPVIKAQDKARDGMEVVGNASVNAAGKIIELGTSAITAISQITGFGDAVADTKEAISD